ncbi:MAG: hypothetical protein JW795_14735 [Chitinivibrionales bacterium]|nr:hypothetical protein [Chitinivibrionales bacterium]
MKFLIMMVVMIIFVQAEDKVYQFKLPSDTSGIVVISEDSDISKYIGGPPRFLYTMFFGTWEVLMEREFLVYQSKGDIPVKDIKFCEIQFVYNKRLK